MRFLYQHLSGAGLVILTLANQINALLAFPGRCPLGQRMETSMTYPQPHMVPARTEISSPEGAQGTFRIRCFGPFSMMIEGRAIDIGAVRPRVRRLLRLLAFRAGRPVHREVLTEALWPGADPAMAGRNLHVAISTLRHVLEPGLPKGAANSLICRDGETYRLHLPADASVDVLEFDGRLAAARAALNAHHLAEALGEFRRALALYEGDLLPEEGPSEWIVRERDRRRLDISELAAALAEALLIGSEPEEAAWVCRRALQVDRYLDVLWRRLVRACDQAGDPAASARARRDYEALLLELGLPASNSDSETRLVLEPERALYSS
jgi:DNA-binding SARP family transcriptional activator